MPITIRGLVEDDIDEVVAFSLRAWAPNFASFRRLLGDEIYSRVYPDWRASQARDVAGICRGYLDTTWVAAAGAHPVGFIVVVLNREAGSADIEMLAVDPAHQRRGVATALLEHAFDRMREAGIHLAAVGTGGDPGHAAARRAYEKAGFTALPLVRYYRPL